MVQFLAYDYRYSRRDNNFACNKIRRRRRGQVLPRAAKGGRQNRGIYRRDDERTEGRQGILSRGASQSRFRQGKRLSLLAVDQGEHIRQHADADTRQHRARAVRYRCDSGRSVYTQRRYKRFDRLAHKPAYRQRSEPRRVLGCARSVVPANDAAVLQQYQSGFQPSQLGRYGYCRRGETVRSDRSKARGRRRVRNARKR